MEPGIAEISAGYANNVKYCQELRICLSVHDWSKFVNQPFFRELIEYLDRIQIQGLFNTGISLFMTIIIGIPGGYMIGTFLEKAGMSTGFVFPTRAFLLFVTVMLLLEVLMTILLIHSWKKQSVIEIMRN